MPLKHNIDLRTVKCACNNPHCCQAGISFDSDPNILHFHYMDTEGTRHVSKTKSMILGPENVSQLITELQNIKFQSHE